MKIEELKNKVPDLADTNEPYSFVQRMRQKGLTVITTETVQYTGKTVEVKIPEKELSLFFVSPGICQISEVR